MKSTLVETKSPAIPAGVARVGSLQWLRANSTFVLGLLCVLFVVLSAVLAPWISPHDPTAQELEIRLLPPAWVEGGRPGFLLGTDQLGRDILSRIFYGGRISLLVAVAATSFSGTLGTLLGLFAGYFGGKVEALIMSLIDIQLALPFVVLSLAVVAVVGPSVTNIIVLLMLTQWVAFGRVVRGVTMALKEADFVVAAQALGANQLHIALRHILPNASGPTLALAIPRVASMILAEAGLSFLGIGVQPPTPTWGGMLSDARTYLHQAPWMAIFPGLALMITVLGINLLGDWLRGVLDPRQRGRG